MELPIHRTTKSDCFLDKLPGARAEEYCSHTSNSVGNLARVYSHFHGDTDYQTIRKQIIANISNTLTDRVATNICLLNKSWNKSLN